MADPDLAAVAIDAKIRNVLRDGVIPLKFTLTYQYPRQSRGESLGNGGDPKRGVLIDRLVSSSISMADGADMDDFFIVHHNVGSTENAFLADVIAEKGFVIAKELPFRRIGEKGSDLDNQANVSCQSQDSSFHRAGQSMFKTKFDVILAQIVAESIFHRARDLGIPAPVFLDSGPDCEGLFAFRGNSGYR